MLRHDARMSFAAALVELLACPSCGTRLTGASCLACRADYPEIGGIPWLMPEPRLALTEWRGRLHHLLTHYASEAARQRAALAAPGTGPLARSRIERVAAALDDQSARIRELMRPLGVGARAEAHAVHVALGTELPIEQGLTTYYPNLHRDWCWGEAENRASLEAVLGSLPAGTKPRRVLVIGAGAGRLAYDLHQALRPVTSVALDFNPFFLLAAARISAGTPLELYEFPIAPRSIDDHAVLRCHAAPGPAAAGFIPVLADASAPPFRAGQFDLVLTPWFIDVASEPIARILPRINALLAPAGAWVNHGSLAFADADPADSWSLEELSEQVAEAGFSRPQPKEASQPYLASPASRHARVESVVTFCVRKERDIPAPAAGRELPEWIARTDLPVPALPAFRAQALAMRVYAFLLAMIDGERSIRDMARLMEQQKLMPAEDALPAIRRFLARALRDPDRRPQF
jgi:SAM-dependent methyltransferase